MIITRTPLRVSFAGGGSDLHAYYQHEPGVVLSTAIDKYVYLAVKPHFDENFRISYSKTEFADTVGQIEHRLVRECLTLLGIERGCEIVSMADLPARTGLGSSSSFTVGLLHALYADQGKVVTAERLAAEACRMEIEKLGEPIGKQDQYIAAYGGITCFNFLPDNQVVVEPLKIPAETLANLEDNLLLFFTGSSRNASDILRDQDSRTKQNNSEMIENLHFTKQLGVESRDALLAGDLKGFADLMNVHWEHKKKRSPGMSSNEIDQLYDLAKANGARGGKLIGAGGGGFLMFYTEEKTRLRRAMRAAGLREVRLQFDFAGTTVVAHS